MNCKKKLKGKQDFFNFFLIKYFQFVKKYIIIKLNVFIIINICTYGKQ